MKKEYVALLFFFTGRIGAYFQYQTGGSLANKGEPMDTFHSFIYSI